MGIYTRRQSPYSQKGFTLAELMISLLIAAILMAVGVPTMSSFIRDNRSVAAANSLKSAVALARAEAVRRSSNVTLCPSTDGTNCASGASDWSGGMAIITDKASGTAAPVTDQVLRVDQSNKQMIVTKTSAGQSWVRFNSRGMLLGQAVTLSVKPSTCTAGNKFYQIVVSVAGQVTLTKSTC